MKLQKFYFIIIILMSFILQSSCKLPIKGINEDKRKTIKNNIVSETSENISLIPVEISQEKKIRPKENTEENNNLKINLMSFIGKNIKDFPNFIKNPTTIIKHGIVVNYQYHLKNCKVDFFFKKLKSDLILDHFELRASQNNKEIFVLNCQNELGELIKIKN